MRQKLSELRLELFPPLVHPAQDKSMSSLPGCMSLAAAPAAADSAEIAELQQAVVEARSSFRLDPPRPHE